MRNFSSLLMVVAMLGGCSRLPPKPLLSHHQVVNDRKLIKKPQASDEEKWGEYLRVNTLDRIAPLADVRTYGIWLGQALGSDPGREAENLNLYDDVADSTWFTHRHARRRMTMEDIAQGAVQQRMATEGPLVVKSGKGSGVTPGFIVEDVNGERFVLKFDPPFACGLATGADVVSSRFFYAAGYNVPENHIEYIDPKRFILSPKATTKDIYGEKISLDQAAFERLIDGLPPCRKDGQVRTMASRFLPGIPIGPFSYRGRRRDDANDRIRHELRRELRGAMVLGAWLNNTDMTSYNTLDMFQPVEGDLGYTKHFLIDFGATLGSGSTKYKSNRYGNEYFLDPPIIGLNLAAFGLRDPEYLYDERIRYKSIGILPTELYDPEWWRPSNPNAALTFQTKRDGFWGARLLAAFSDEDIRAVVRQGQYDEEGAEDELIRILIYRRDKTLRYWLNRVGSLDMFSVEGKVPEFYFVDWRRDTIASQEEGAGYRWQLEGPLVSLEGYAKAGPIKPFAPTTWESWRSQLESGRSRYLKLRITPVRTKLKETLVYKAPKITRMVAPPTEAYYYWTEDHKLVWVGVKRDVR